MKIENFQSMISNKANNCTSIEWKVESGKWKMANGKWQMEHGGIFIWFIPFGDGSFAKEADRLLAYFMPIVEDWDAGNPG